MSGAIPPLPNTSSWRGAELEKITEITLPLTLPLPLTEIKGQVIWNFFKRKLQQCQLI
jgi:hypothetical protein